MPNKTEFRDMKKAQLVDFGCNFFEDTGNLRQELGDMKKDDLLELLFESGAHIDPEETPPMENAELKKGMPSKTDLGNW